MLGSPRPSYGPARNYGTQGHNEYGRLETWEMANDNIIPTYNVEIYM